VGATSASVDAPVVTKCVRRLASAKKQLERLAKIDEQVKPVVEDSCDDQCLSSFAGETERRPSYL
jgi:hypothetical protein